MNGTMAQNSEPRRSTCAEGVNGVSLLVKFGRNARKKRIVSGFDIDIRMPRPTRRQPLAAAGLSAFSPRCRNPSQASLNEPKARWPM